MRTFSELTGLSPAVLRAWERRHGLLQPATTDGGHRLYTEEDLHVMRRVSALLEQGRAIGEIAALGRDALLERDAPEASAESRRPVDALDSLREAIVEAAKRLDAALLFHTLDKAFALFSVETVLDEVVQPATVAIGQGWADGVISVAGEHLVTSALTARIQRIQQASQLANPTAPLVVCACLPKEQHELGLLVLALHISGAGFRVTYLGRDLPLDELEAAAERLGAEAVCLSTHRHEVLSEAQAEIASLARRWKDRIRVHLGCPDETDRSELEAAGVFLWPRRFDLRAFCAQLVPSHRDRLNR